MVTGYAVRVVRRTDLMIPGNFDWINNSITICYSGYYDTGMIITGLFLLQLPIQHTNVTGNWNCLIK